MVQLIRGREPSPLTLRRRRHQHRRPHHTFRLPSHVAVTVIADDSDSDTLMGDSDSEDNDDGDELPQGYAEDDGMTDEDFAQWLSNSALFIAPRNARPQRNTREVVLQFVSGNRTYKAGKSVELHDGTFLRIQEVVRDVGGDGGVSLRGLRLKRQEEMDGLLPIHINELCWVIDMSPEEAEAGLTTNTDEVKLSEVKRLRIIHLTNALFSDTTYNDGFANDNERLEEGHLFCRFKYIQVWTTTTSRKVRIIEQVILALSSDEADSGFATHSETLQYDWRGKTRLGGSSVHQETSAAVIDLSQSLATEVPATSKTVARYTFGDSFCGAGGISCGASQAGLAIKWAFDKCVNAMNTYRLNFPTAIGETSDVADFLTNPLVFLLVDILHLSPPCQTFSPAHTIAAATDEANEACIFALRELISKSKPRIVTMEETAGLVNRHSEFLFATIHTFVEFGYSVRWKVVNCADYGVPQTRERVIIIAAGPGETLPSFPPATHGPAGNIKFLPLYRTIHDAISSIPSNAANHDIHRAYRSTIQKVPFNPHIQAKTITCNGGEGNYHPSGERSFTHREMACLQTFPPRYKFCGANTVKQIGNAVPPMLARAMFEHIRKSLERADGVAPREVISLL
ncbi:hypothetical protein FQN53_007473 [Emmonsiellopsis sp. PD_33]|nr:hypothetical protein FQN53_007473 [Emmonsiellopsis sp. PD_33]